MATSANIWHRRLGHPNSHIRSLLASNKKVVCTSHHHNFQCQACPLEKSSRLSLGPTSHKTSTPFGLIFSDVWVFAPMLSSDGFHYFVIFIDAYTKFIWFYPIPFPLTYRSPHHHLHLCLLIILQVQVLWCQLYLSRIRPLLQPLQPHHHHCLLHLGTLLSPCPVWTYVWISPHTLFHNRPPLTSLLLRHPFGSITWCYVLDSRRLPTSALFLLPLRQFQLHE